MRSPADEGFRQPAEWAPQSRVWTAWPHIPEWGDHLAPTKDEVEAMIRCLAEHVPVAVVCASSAQAREVRARLPLPAVTAHEAIFGDIWLRDIGPVFLLDGAARLGAACLRFNGWGGKYIFPGDAELGGVVAGWAHARAFPLSLVLEGGALEIDGEGTCLTTRQCALNPNRTPGAREEDIARAIRGALGVERVLWLDEGLANDHTDGHIDTLARFVAPGVVVCMEPVTDDPNRDVLVAIRRSLGEMRDARGRRLELHTVPSPGRVTLEDGAVMPASYVNFLITNGVVVVPTYGSPHDDAAIRRLEPLFPGRRVVGLSARALLSGGGAFHCITQQEPQAKGETP